mmetsp:Transcript_24341/g.84590  ORF Transcript_24341/g.84590 Transcript_24341/m.84590 type:complete len:218 (+) Transcript_24341:1293-1946(+)
MRRAQRDQRMRRLPRLVLPVRDRAADVEDAVLGQRLRLQAAAEHARHLLAAHRQQPSAPVQALHLPAHGELTARLPQLAQRAQQADHIRQHRRPVRRERKLVVAVVGPSAAVEDRAPADAPEGVHHVQHLALYGDRLHPPLRLGLPNLNALARRTRVRCQPQVPQQALRAAASGRDLRRRPVLERRRHDVRQEARLRLQLVRRVADEDEHLVEQHGL